MLSHRILVSQDIQLMKSLGHRNYRFSISWPRIFPNGTGEINQVGLLCLPARLHSGIWAAWCAASQFGPRLHPAAALAARIRKFVLSYQLPSGAALTSTALPNRC